MDQTKKKIQNIMIKSEFLPIVVMTMSSIKFILNIN